MLTSDELNRIYAEKLLKTGSHDQALQKVAWIAFKSGIEAGKLSETAKTQ